MNCPKRRNSLLYASYYVRGICNVRGDSILFPLNTPASNKIARIDKGKRKETKKGKVTRKEKRLSRVWRV